MNIVKFDDYPVFLCKDNSTGTIYHMEEKEFFSKPDNLVFVARFSCQGDVNAFMNVFANKRGFEHDFINIDNYTHIKLKNGQEARIGKVENSHRRICSVGDGVPFSSKIELIKQGYHIYQESMYEEKDAPDRTYRGNRYSVYGDSILHDRDLNEISWNPGKCHQLTRKLTTQKVTMRYVPLFYEMKDMAEKLFYGITEIVGISRYSCNRGIYRYDDVFDWFNEYTKIYIHNIKFISKSEKHSFKSTINMLMKKYRFKNIHEKKISELNTYFEKHNAENTKDSILSEKTEKLRRLKEEQKKFNHVYDHMIALKKKLK